MPDAPAGSSSSSTATVEAASARADRLVVCIPTYRRPARLASLLRALGAQKGRLDFDVVVGNNEPGDLRRHAELADPGLPPFRVVDVAMRGVSAVRNAMIASVLEQPSVPRWLACIDDDQHPAPDWLRTLVEVGEAYDADLVGGPVDRTVAAATFWSAAAADTSYLPQRTGPTPMLNEGGNLLIATRWLRTLDRPPFSLAFGLSGGEDYEFFLLARQRGARMIWASEAKVEEPLREDRLTFGGYVSRYFTIAAYQTRADLLYGSVFAVATELARDVARGVRSSGAALVGRRSPKEAILQALRFGAVVAGRLVGLCGIAVGKYGKP